LKEAEYFNNFNSLGIEVDVRVNTKVLELMDSEKTQVKPLKLVGCIRRDDDQHYPVKQALFLHCI
jgi:hypothetical protein